MSARRAIESIWNPDDPDSLSRIIARARVVVGFTPCARCHGVGTVAEHVGEHTMRVTCCDCGGAGGTHTYADEGGEGK